jgi:hypothetical protein
MKTTKRPPCTLPTYFTIPGISQIYFRGIAMNNKMSREIPSKKPSIRNLPIDDHNRFIRDYFAGLFLLKSLHEL